MYTRQRTAFLVQRGISSLLTTKPLWKTNACSHCNTCIRAPAEHPRNDLVAGGLRSVRA